MNLFQYGLLSGDDVAVVLGLAKRKRSKKEKRSYFKLLNYPDSKYDFYFRFRRDHIIRLHRGLRLPCYLNTSHGLKFSTLEGIHIMLRRLAYPNRLEELTPMFNRRKDELSRIFNRMIQYVVENFGFLVTTLHQYWLAPAYLENLAQAIETKGGPLPHCWGFIDGMTSGTLRPTCRPHQKQRVAFNGHKRLHGIKFQAVVTPNGLIANLYGPVAGSRHDCFMLTKSNFLQEADHLRQANGQHFYVYGDPAYPHRPQLQCGFRRSRLITPNQAEFNKRMSSVRESVEWEFGKVVRQFAFLDFKKNLKIYLQPVGLYYKAGTILSNCHTCLYGSQTSQYFNLNPPTLEQYLANNELA